ncbi:MAG: hypothetical protein Q9217_002202 [Psora testacea]
MAADFALGTRPMASMTPTPAYRLAHLAPPGRSVLTARLPISESSRPTAASEIPALFHSALQIRSSVFIDEQHCTPESEVDSDDAISTHWILFSASSTQETGQEEDEEEEEVPAATIRLVPAQEHKYGGCEAGDVHTTGGGQGPDYGGSRVWDGE